MSRAWPMVHETDPKVAILADVDPHTGDIAVLGARLLVAVYVRPERTKGSIILSDNTRDEDRYQGKVGLVLRLGPIAFQDDATHRFGAVVPRIGDWIVFSVGDTFAFDLGERRCRTVEDVDVHLIVQSPDCLR